MLSSDLRKDSLTEMNFSSVIDSAFPFPVLSQTPPLWVCLFVFAPVSIYVLMTSRELDRHGTGHPDCT